MAVYFAESSALAKRYVAEVGSAWIQGLLDPLTGHVVVIARITAAELIAAFSRRERGGSLAPMDAVTARTDFRLHFASEYQIVEVDETVVDRAMLLAEAHSLRGYDAVQLAAAYAVNARYRAAGLPPITILSADTELNAAAVAEGLIVDDPNAHP
jgi:predicted nucleic acid-binding protein